MMVGYYRGYEMIIKEIINRFRFWLYSDRIGPDILLTHFLLYIKSTMKWLCKKKFKVFADSADFRPGAYAIGCSNISIGKRVVVRPTCMFFSIPGKENAEIIIEDDVLMGSGVHIYVSNHKFSNPKISIIDQGFSEPSSVKLKKGCWLGANVIILPGVTIGERSVIGAGSVVTKDIPDEVVAVGNPARVIRKLEELDG